MKKLTYQGLRTFNLAMAVLHGISGLLMLVLSTDFSLPVTSSFLMFDPVSQTLQPVLETLATVRIGPLVAGFLFLSAFAHLAISLNGVYENYVANLKRGINYARWIEYSLSSSLMIVVISMLVGIYDIGSLILIFFLNVAMILFGWLMELHNQTTQKTNWTSYWFGTLVGLVPWLVVAIYLVGAGGADAGPPSFVYWIYGSIFAFFSIFAVNMAMQYLKVGPWKSYLYGERVYIILSLVAKSLLAWQVWAGTLRPL